ncbi:D-Ala-D-Ala carboxypeptidase family metallohydrolase [Minwuia sp.]|uniref:D-Ala-D-Ala carboxypeptidase family metallohydrolase n=1 Tax=Minwuia sp. TaxID=2493630 RepID=UPI003A95C941
MNWQKFPNFGEIEFRCRCGCGRAEMDMQFVSLLQAVRTELGMPLPISSGFRCPDHNRAVGGGPAHPEGKAADIAIRGGAALDLVRLAVSRGATGIGVKQSGQARFVHIDTLMPGETAAPRPWLWSY